MTLISKFINLIIDNMSDFACKKLSIDNKVYNSEISHSEHNLAIAHLLKSYNKFKLIDVKKKC